MGVKEEAGDAEINRETSDVGRGDFQKKSQKVPAFWKMAAVTVIRLMVYMGIPSCIALYCRPRTMGVENIK